MPAYNETAISQKTAGAIPGDNPMYQLSQMHERTVALCNRVDTLCDRLLGGSPLNEPQDASTGSAIPPNRYSGGVVGGIVTDTRTLNEKLLYAEEALSRIEAVVGPF